MSCSSSASSRMLSGSTLERWTRWERTSRSRTAELCGAIVLLLIWSSVGLSRLLLRYMSTQLTLSDPQETSEPA